MILHLWSTKLLIQLENRTLSSKKIPRWGKIIFHFQVAEAVVAQRSSKRLGSKKIARLWVLFQQDAGLFFSSLYLCVAPLIRCLKEVQHCWFCFFVTKLILRCSGQTLAEKFSIERSWTEHFWRKYREVGIKGKLSSSFVLTLFFYFEAKKKPASVSLKAWFSHFSLFTTPLKSASKTAPSVGEEWHQIKFWNSEIQVEKAAMNRGQDKKVTILYFSMIHSLWSQPDTAVHSWSSPRSS